jgi:hypothetical protein
MLTEALRAADEFDRTMGCDIPPEPR